ncbi:NotI family restriction endonuclease [Cupriavidus sp. WKF15]|uniref:NotI family restriction endonuclease n=1 Tax=Cupriavidus sp. WKF15 TaxID=3032282 RepID=UPI0023E298C4|nr:NotI family restriction endonuclease [Cupriavidus sp. WKF15]WER46022.1 NotI family restriction endonuclease [Cupriavidus sp. WKF15]
MASRIIEFFGYAPGDRSLAAQQARATRSCPFIGGTCQKTLSDRELSGACTLQPVRGAPVICCPIRLYANQYQILHDVAAYAFDGPVVLYPGAQARNAPLQLGTSRVAVFGKAWGGELRLPNRSGVGGYYVDWVLAKLTDDGATQEFVAVEVQSIDTTGNYREERAAYLREEPYGSNSTAGFNWENVSKRILPQLIYKGNVLQRERLCRKGLFFVSPTPVYEKIAQRLGQGLLEYHLQTGSISFMWYNVGDFAGDGQLRNLNREGVFTTSVVQVANAFSSPTNLPDANVYERAIHSAL